MHIMVLWQGNYPWDVRIDKFVRSFVRMGHSVTVLSSNTNNMPRDGTYLGAAVRRLPHYGIFRRVLQMPVPFSPIWRHHAAQSAALQAPNVVMVRDLPLMQIGYRVAKANRAKLWFDMAEDYPATFEHLESSAISRLTVRNYNVARRYEKWALSVADHVTVVIDESLERVNKLFPDREPGWSQVITNAPDDYFLSQLSCVGHVLPFTDGLRALYHGNLEAKRGLDTVMNALGILKDRGVVVKMTILGNPEHERQRLLRYASTRRIGDLLDIRPPVTYEQLPGAISQCQIGLVPHVWCEHTATTIPNKLFDMMALAKPVIVSSVPPLRRVVEGAQCGLVYRWDSPVELANALQYVATHADVAEHMGQNGLRAYNEVYAWRHCEPVIAEILG